MSHEIECPACEDRNPMPPGRDGLMRCPACNIRFLPPESRSVSVLTRNGDQPEEVRQTLQVTDDFLERYSVGALIGAGGLGCVYQAMDRRRSVPVAIKVLVKPEQNQSIRFLREGKLLYAIRHPHVLPVYEIGKLGDHPYLVMEFMPHGTLRNRMAGERLSLGECLFVVRDVLAGLQVCHERGVVHRDMKPENILMMPDGGAKVADLGIAKDYTDEDENLTATGTIIGSPRYMSPEQVRGEPPVIATDLYAVGLILYELVAGGHPFKVTNVFQLLKCHEQVNPPRVETVVGDIPAPVANVIHRAIAKRIGDRPQTAEEFLFPIVKVLRELEKRGDAPVRQAPLPRPPRALASAKDRGATAALTPVTPVTDADPPVAVYLPEAVVYDPTISLTASERKRRRLHRHAGAALAAGLGSMLMLAVWSRGSPAPSAEPAARISPAQSEVIPVTSSPDGSLPSGTSPGSPGDGGPLTPQRPLGAPPLEVSSPSPGTGGPESPRPPQGEAPNAASPLPTGPRSPQGVPPSGASPRPPRTVGPQPPQGAPPVGATPLPPDHDVTSITSQATGSPAVHPQQAAFPQGQGPGVPSPGQQGASSFPNGPYAGQQVAFPQGQQSASPQGQGPRSAFPQGQGPGAPSQGQQAPFPGQRSPFTGKQGAVPFGDDPGAQSSFPGGHFPSQQGAVPHGSASGTQAPFPGGQPPQQVAPGRPLPGGAPLTGPANTDPIPIVESANLYSASFLRHRQEVTRLRIDGFPKTLTAMTYQSRWTWSLADQSLISRDELAGPIVRTSEAGDALLVLSGRQIMAVADGIPEGAIVPVEADQVLIRPENETIEWEHGDLGNAGAGIAIGKGGRVIVAAAGKMLKVWIWKGKAFEESDQQPAPARLLGLSLSPDGERLVVFRENDSPVLWETAPLAAVAELDKLDPGRARIEFSGDSSVLVAQDDRTSMVYDGRDGSLRGRFSMVGPAESWSQGSVRVALSGDGRHLATAGSLAGWVSVYDISACKSDPASGIHKTLKQVAAWNHMHPGIRGIDFSPSGAQLLITGNHGQISIHETRSGRLRMPTDALQGWIPAFGLSPDGRWLVLQSTRGLHRHDLQKADPAEDWFRPGAEGGTVGQGSAFMPYFMETPEQQAARLTVEVDDRGRVASADRRKLDLFVPPSTQPAWSRKMSASFTPRPSLHFDGDRLILLEGDAVTVLDSASGKELERHPHAFGHGEIFHCIGLEGGEGRWFYGLTSENELQVREVTGSRVLSRLDFRLTLAQRTPDGPLAFRLTDGGRRILVGSLEGKSLEVDLIGTATGMLPGVQSPTLVRSRSSQLFHVSYLDGKPQLVVHGNDRRHPRALWSPAEEQIYDWRLAASADSRILVVPAAGGGFYRLVLRFDEPSGAAR